MVLVPFIGACNWVGTMGFAKFVSLQFDADKDRNRNNSGGGGDLMRLCAGPWEMDKLTRDCRFFWGIL